MHPTSNPNTLSHPSLHQHTRLQNKYVGITGFFTLIQQILIHLLTLGPITSSTIPKVDRLVSSAGLIGEMSLASVAFNYFVNSKGEEGAEVLDPPAESARILFAFAVITSVVAWVLALKLADVFRVDAFKVRLKEERKGDGENGGNGGNGGNGEDGYSYLRAAYCVAEVLHMVSVLLLVAGLTIWGVSEKGIAGPRSKWGTGLAFIVVVAGLIALFCAVGERLKYEECERISALLVSLATSTYDSEKDIDGSKNTFAEKTERKYEEVKELSHLADYADDGDYASYAAWYACKPGFASEGYVV